MQSLLPGPVEQQHDRDDRRQYGGPGKDEAALHARDDTSIPEPAPRLEASMILDRVSERFQGRTRARRWLYESGGR